MNILNTLKHYLDFALLSGVVAFWALWKARGRTIQAQKIKIESQADSAEITPLVTDAKSLDAQMEDLDADRLKKETRLNDALSGKPPGGG